MKSSYFLLTGIFAWWFFYTMLMNMHGPYEINNDHVLPSDLGKKQTNPNQLYCLLHNTSLL